MFPASGNNYYDYFKQHNCVKQLIINTTNNADMFDYTNFMVTNDVKYS